MIAHTHTHTHTHTVNGALSGTTRVSRYQKGKNQSGLPASIDRSVHARHDTDRTVLSQCAFPSSVSSSSLTFSGCRPTNSVKALKAIAHDSQRARLVTSPWAKFGFRFGGGANPPLLFARSPSLSTPASSPLTLALEVGSSPPFPLPYPFFLAASPPFP